MKKLLLISLAISSIISLEQDGFLAKEELDNYTVYLMSKSVIQASGSFQTQCPGGFLK